MSFGPQFGPRPNNIRFALQPILSGTSIADQPTLIETWVTARPNNPRVEEEILTTHIGGTTWEWPLFDKWRKAFHEGGTWPPDWQMYGDIYVKGLAKGAWTERQLVNLEKQRIKILARDLNKRANILRSIEDHQRAALVMGIEPRWELRGGEDGPLAEPLEAKARQALERGDTTLLPPLFPGSRAWIVSIID